MRLALPRLAIALLLLLQASSAQALCSYNGVYNAPTTIRQEYRDSRWVVRVRVLSATDGNSREDGAWTVYRLGLLRAYKGRPPARTKFFTWRNSGGFYMDRPWADLPAGHDIGGEYLLFLNPRPERQGWPSAARGAVFVNYSCGQSREWRKVGPRSRQLLESLSKRR